MWSRCREQVIGSVPECLQNVMPKMAGWLTKNDNWGSRDRGGYPMTSRSIITDRSYTLRGVHVPRNEVPP